MTMKPWREIAVPHRDVLEGTFQQSEFAADITAVHSGKASKEYQDASAFFDRTAVQSKAEAARAHNEVVTSWCGIESAAKEPAATQRTLFD